jgi:hypothetical protein
MATVKETGVELSEEEWRRFEAGVAAELACRTRSWDSRQSQPKPYCGVPDERRYAFGVSAGRSLGARHDQP